MAIAEILQELLKADKEERDVNLNRLKTKISSKYGLETSPRLVDIIAAVPVESRKILYPKLRAKPIRTASGVSIHRFSIILYYFIPLISQTYIFYILDSRGCCYVQTTSLSSHQHDREYLCLLPRRT